MIMKFTPQAPGAKETQFSPGRPTAWLDQFLVFAPISLFVVLGKLATYFSYEYVSMSLTHTAKASEPIFNVVLSGLLFGEVKPLGVYASLVPIAAGVALASTSEVTYNHIGFISATISAMMKVMQNIYTKRVMNRNHFTFFEIHFWCGLASFIVMLPIIFFNVLSSSENPFNHFPVFQLFVCSLLQYGSSVSSYVVLSLVTHLTFTITNTMKRLVIIGSGILYFNQGFGLLNSLGVLLSVGGILMYNLVKDTKDKHAPDANSTASGLVSSSSSSSTSVGGVDTKDGGVEGAGLARGDGVAFATAPRLANGSADGLEGGPDADGESNGVPVGGWGVGKRDSERARLLGTPTVGGASTGDWKTGAVAGAAGVVTMASGRWGLRPGGLDATDSERERADPYFDEDIARTESYG